MSPKKQDFINPFADPAFDSIVAPRISELEEFTLPEIDKAIEPDPVQFSNTAFLLSFDKERTSRGLSVLINARNAMEEYLLAKSRVELFFRHESHPWYYYKANFHFQTCVQCIAVGQDHTFSFRRKQKFRDEKGSEHQKRNETLWKLYNSSKHHEGNLRRKSSGLELLSFYWTKAGIECPGGRLGYGDISFMLRDLCLSARLISQSGFWQNTGVTKELAQLFFDELQIAFPPYMIRR